MGKKR